jgi:hypothetical protein
MAARAIPTNKPETDTGALLDDAALLCKMRSMIRSITSISWTPVDAVTAVPLEDAAAESVEAAELLAWVVVA